MRVRIYDCAGGVETLRGEADLLECLPNDEGTFWEVARELQRSGWAWVGGGAAPLVRLMMGGLVNG